MNETENIVEEVTPVEETENKGKKELSMEEIERLSNYVHIEGIKGSLDTQLNEIANEKQQLISSIAGLDAEKDFIQEKLDTFPSVKELTAYLNSDERLTEFYTNPETGEVMQLSVAIDDPKREKEFRRELLIYMKTTDDAHADIDKAYEELDRSTKEIDAELREACIQLSDNVLTYIGYLRDRAKEMDDGPTKDNILAAAAHIESGYTFELMQQILDKHPSVIKNTVKELTTGYGIDTTGKRYNDRLSRYKIKVSLLPLVSTDTSKSIEEMVLIKDDEYILPDLFIYSAIRYFAMADWDNENVKRFHATLALVLKRLMNNELDAEVKERVLGCMVKYLAQFKPFI